MTTRKIGQKKDIEKIKKLKDKPEPQDFEGEQNSNFSSMRKS